MRQGAGQAVCSHQETMRRLRGPSRVRARPHVCVCTHRKPIAAMWVRISSATMKRKLITCSGSPANLARSSGSCYKGGLRRVETGEGG